MAIPELITSLLPFFNKKQNSGSTKILGLSEASELIDYVDHEFTQALDFEYKNRERESKAWRMFTGFSNGQWEAEIISAMKKEGRNPFQANFIRQKVEGLAGSLLKNFFDVGFEPIDGEFTDLVLSLLAC